MWEAIQHVGEPLAFCAFIVAVAATVFRAVLRHKIKIIEISLKDNQTPDPKHTEELKKLDLEAYRVKAKTITIISISITALIAVVIIVALIWNEILFPSDPILTAMEFDITVTAAKAPANKVLLEVSYDNQKKHIRPNQEDFSKVGNEYNYKITFVPPLDLRKSVSLNFRLALEGETNDDFTGTVTVTALMSRGQRRKLLSENFDVSIDGHSKKSDDLNWSMFSD